MNDLDIQFDAKVQQIFDATVERYPALATGLGIHKFDDKLTDMSAKRKAEDIRTWEAWLVEIRQFDNQALSEDRRSDLAGLTCLLEASLFHTKEIRPWSRNPYSLLGFIDHIDPLLRRDFAPLDERMRLIAARTGKAPEFFAQLRTLIQDAPEKLWTDMAVEACGQTAGFLDSVLETASSSGQVSAPVLIALDQAVKQAKAAVAEHRKWIQDELMSKTVTAWSMGRQLFEGVLERRMLGMNSDQLLALGNRLVEQDRDRLKELAAEVVEASGMKPAANAVEVARDLIERDRPGDFAGALSAYQEAVRESRQFVIDHRLATLPDGEKLTVIETPVYLRPTTPFAAYIQPARFEESQEGIYFVTPQEDMSQFSYAGIRNTTVHEGYPGHHLQLCRANRNPRLARALLHPTETVEGWAHYCEGMMKEHGYRDGIRDRFAQVNDELWRAARIVLDVRMHRGEISFDEAVSFLKDNTGMSQEAATAEVKRYTFTPGYQLSYLVGKLMIEELKEKVRKAKGDKYNEKEFHDRFLSRGNLPVKLIEKEFGV